MNIGFIGAGKVGTAFGIYLKKNRYLIYGYYSRTFDSAVQAAKMTDSKAVNNMAELALNSQIIFITTNDDEIENVCNKLTSDGLLSHGKILVHMSGASSSHLLKKAKKVGCFVYSLHPLQSFADIDKAVKDLEKTVFSIEGDKEKIDVLENILRKTGNDYFKISAEQKSIYHAAACVISNYLVTVIDNGLSLLNSIGIDKENGYKAMYPLIEGTINNLLKLGPEKALTGPIARGDVKTVKKHILSLSENNTDSLEFYRIMGLKTLEIAVKEKLKDKKIAKCIENILKEE